MAKPIGIEVRSRFVAGGGLACLAAVLLMSACAADVPEETTSAQGALACHDKITICHHTRSETNPTVTISISRIAWPAHAKHGDTMGACEPVPPPQPQCGNGVVEGSEECDETPARPECLVDFLCSECGPTICNAQCQLIQCDPGPD